MCDSVCLVKQGVALTGRKATGPPSRAAPWWVTLRRRGVLQTTTDANEQNDTGPTASNSKWPVKLQSVKYDGQSGSTCPVGYTWWSKRITQGWYRWVGVNDAEHVQDYGAIYWTNFVCCWPFVVRYHLSVTLLCWSLIAVSLMHHCGVRVSVYLSLFF